MGLLNRARQKRRDRKLAEKIAKRQAKSRAKDEKKLNAKKEKYLNKTAKMVMKQDAKDRKDQRKHEKDLAQAAVQQIRERSFSPAKAAKWAGALRVAAPVVIPLIYSSEQSQETGAVCSGLVSIPRRRCSAESSCRECASSGEGRPVRFRQGCQQAARSSAQ